MTKRTYEPSNYHGAIIEVKLNKIRNAVLLPPLIRFNYLRRLFFLGMSVKWVLSHRFCSPCLTVLLRGNLPTCLNLDSLE